MGFGKSIGEYLVEIIKYQKLKDCSRCKKQHTEQCPDFSKCWDTLEKPYFEEKVVD